MHCVYINLDHQSERRAALEANFATFTPANWSLERLAGIDGEAARAARPEVKLRPSETGCYLSHLAAIERAGAREGHVLICEDDVLFGQSSAHIITSVSSSLPSGDWDILFPEVGIAQPEIMVDLFRRRRAQIEKMQVRTIDLAKYPFFSATAYILNERSKRRAREVFSALPLNEPFDMALRRLIHSGTFKAHVIFPFATSISRFATHSQIQKEEHAVTDLAWNEFRKLMWVDRDMSALDPGLAKIANDMTDPETAHLARILEINLSRAFRSK